MAVYPTIPPLKPYQIFDPTSGATTDWEGAGLPDYTGPSAPTLTAPAAGGVSGSVTFTATIPAATYEDWPGTDIAKVEFYGSNDAKVTEVKLGEDTSGAVSGVDPNRIYTYTGSYSVAGLTNGANIVYARVIDAAGNSTDSPTVSVTKS